MTIKELISELHDKDVLIDLFNEDTLVRVAIEDENENVEIKRVNEVDVFYDKKDECHVLYLKIDK